MGVRPGVSFRGASQEVSEGGQGDSGGLRQFLEGGVNGWGLVNCWSFDRVFRFLSGEPVGDDEILTG